MKSGTFCSTFHLGAFSSLLYVQTFVSISNVGSTEWITMKEHGWFPRKEELDEILPGCQAKVARSIASLLGRLLALFTPVLR